MAHPTSSLGRAGRLYAFLEWFWEGVGLSVLWVIACLPVVTAGAATSALFAVVTDRRRGHTRPTGQAFWDEFRIAPLQRAAASVALVVVAAGVLLTFGAGARADTLSGLALQGATVAGGGVLLGVLVVFLPLSAISASTLPARIRLAAAIAMARPRTAFVGGALTLALVVATVLMPPVLLILGWAWARLLVDLTAAAAASLRVGGAEQAWQAQR